MAKGFSTEKNGSSWVCRIKYKDIRTSKTFRTKSAAENWARQLTNLIDEGKYNGKDIFARQQTYSFLDRLSQMIPDLPTTTEKNKQRKKDYSYFKNIIERHDLSKLPFDTVTTDNLIAER